MSGDGAVHTGSVHRFYRCPAPLSSTLLAPPHCHPPHCCHLAQFFAGPTPLSSCLIPRWPRPTVILLNSLLALPHCHLAQFLAGPTPLSSCSIPRWPYPTVILLNSSLAPPYCHLAQFLAGPTPLSSCSIPCWPYPTVILLHWLVQYLFPADCECVYVCAGGCGFAGSVHGWTSW